MLNVVTVERGGARCTACDGRYGCVDYRRTAVGRSRDAVAPEPRGRSRLLRRHQNNSSLANQSPLALLVNSLDSNVFTDTLQSSSAVL